MSNVGQTRLKTGGRIKGTPNKRTLDIQQRLDDLGCDPIVGMAKLAQDENNPPELRGRMYSELAQYIAPKRRAIEVAAEVDASSSWTNLVLSSEELMLKLGARRTTE